MLKIFLLFFLLLSKLCTSQEESIVAEVGDRKIYESEFKERFDFSIHPRLPQNSDKHKAKLDFLNQLIAEKLLSLEAENKGCDTLLVFRDLMTPLGKMFIRDALYTSEIKNKISYSPDGVEEGLNRINKILKLNFIYTNDINEIEKIYSALRKGASFDSILSLRKEAHDQVKPMEITFGTMDKSVEDQVYNLKTGEFTQPIKSGDGYYILKLLSAENNPSLKNRELALDEVKRIVQKRAEYKRFREFHGNIFKDEKISADKEIFNALASALDKKLKAKYSGSDPVQNKFYLIGVEVSSVSDLLQPDLFNKRFIDLQSPVYLNSFLNQLSQEGFYVQDTTGLSIRSSLSSYIRKFIEDQVLAEEGERNGLNNSVEVKKYTSMWRDYYLSKMMMIDFFDSIKISEEEAYSLYEQNKDSGFHLALVNIAEVLTDSLNVVEIVLNELAEGKNIKDLARNYTKRDSLREKGGEFGFFPVTEHGELGKIASRMSVGEVYGPVKLDEGYSVFQLLDKKEDSAGLRMDYHEVKDQIIMMLTLEKFEKFVNEYNAKLAYKYGVKIYEDVLKDIQNSFLNLVVVRYMGFGGQILAVPYTEQFSGWFELWQESKSIVQ